MIHAKVWKNLRTLNEVKKAGNNGHIFYDSFYTELSRIGKHIDKTKAGTCRGCRDKEMGNNCLTDLGFYLGEYKMIWS